MEIIIAVLAMPVGIGIGWVLRQLKASATKNSAEMKAESTLKQAKQDQQALILEAKNKALSIIEEAKAEEQRRREAVEKQHDRLEKREALFDEKLLELEDQKQAVDAKAGKIDALRTQMSQVREQQLQQLEQLAGLNQEQAREQLLTSVAKDSSDALASRVQKIQAEANEVYDAKARELLTLAIHRCGLSHAAETTTTVVNLPSEEMKGRIIGKEGRNIKHIENLTGVEVIVDDTPESILVSAFSPIRRHVAKRSLEALMDDGRIHPGRIEEIVERTKKELGKEIRKAGEEALYEMGITGIDPKLIQILGRLRYRTSYGQNVLRHSIEVGILAGLIAEQLGGDVILARRAGLFHDIGKALDHDIQGTHPEIGRDIGRRFSFDQKLADAAFCHHDDLPPSLEGIIVKVADCISGGRPGARKDSYEQYVQRLEELEETANSFAGVKKTYAIAAGREVRVFVEPNQVDDFAAHNLARDIAKKIEADLKYPGEIKVNVIRETRIIEYAR